MLPEHACHPERACHPEYAIQNVLAILTMQCRIRLPSYSREPFHPDYVVQNTLAIVSSLAISEHACHSRIRLPLRNTMHMHVAMARQKVQHTGRNCKKHVHMFVANTCRQKIQSTGGSQCDRRIAIQSDSQCRKFTVVNLPCLLASRCERC